jgi:hypothetical protein
MAPLSRGPSGQAARRSGAVAARVRARARLVAMAVLGRGHAAHHRQVAARVRAWSGATSAPGTGLGSVDCSRAQRAGQERHRRFVSALTARRQRPSGRYADLDELTGEFLHVPEGTPISTR